VRTSELIVVVYLAYLVAAAWATQLPWRRRARVTIVAAVDAALIWWMSRQSGAWTAVRDWQAVPQILIGYELSGNFFQRPMVGVEAWLSNIDRSLFERQGLGVAIARVPRGVLELLETAYVSVYLVLPAGFAVALAASPHLDVDRYWSIVILAELASYATLPWIQTRPPRALNDQMAIAARPVAVRRLNEFILKYGRVQVNTFPSGHAAGALATGLAVAAVSPAAGWAFGLLAVGIVAGSIVGRYHYAADSLAGLLLAVAAWLIWM